MRKCVLNDCTDFKTVAPCCRDCPLKDRCPDRCTNDDIFCANMIEDKENDG